MSFYDDYFRRLLEELSNPQERIVEREERVDERDNLQNIDRQLADKHRFYPERLKSTLDESLLDGPESLPDNIDELFEIRTALCRKLERSDLDEEVVFFLVRSVYVGTLRAIQRGNHTVPPAQMAADLLRQERVAHVLDRDESVEAWRALFDLEADRDNFSYAEDYLFHAVRVAEDPMPLIHRGLDFYDRILALPDDDLESGGLTREECDRARWELLEMVQE